MGWKKIAEEQLALLEKLDQEAEAKDQRIAELKAEVERLRHDKNQLHMRIEELEARPRMPPVPDALRKDGE